MMAKLRPSWMRTNIPKDIKIVLLRLMRDNPTYSAWTAAIASYGFNEKEEKYVRMSRGTYRKLWQEIKEMPIGDIRSLPPDLKIWIRGLRPDLPEELWVEPEDEGRVIISHMWENIRRDKIQRGEPYVDPFTGASVLEF